MGRKFEEEGIGLSWRNCIYQHANVHPIHISRKITIAKYSKHLSELPGDRWAKKAFRQLSLDDTNNHCNWVSMAKSITDEFSPDITESEDKLKNKIRSTLNKTL